MAYCQIFRQDGQFGPPVSTLEQTELLTQCEVSPLAGLAVNEKPDDGFEPEPEKTEHGRK
jgi:hypothetical protein